MLRIRPNAASIGFGYGQADEVPGFRVKTPGFHVGQTDEVPGFRVGQPDVIPGFRMNADGTIRRPLQGGATARYLLDDPNAARETIPVKCTSDGSTFGCTTPRGKSFSNVPVPPNFPARIEQGVPNYHEYGVLSPPGGSSEKLLQGVVDKPTPGPFNRPATSEGTLNEATTPSWLYNLFLGGTRMPYGTPVNPVKSYLWQDSDGKPIVVNVTEPGHGLEPGYSIHYVVETPEGPRIQTEGEGLGYLQSPDRLEWLQKQLSTGTWAPYQQGILDRSK